MRSKNIYKIIFACFIFCFTLKGSGQEKETLILRIENHEAVINDLTAQQRIILDNSGELARKITQLREKPQMSAAEHRQLSQYMRESQQFQAGIDSINAELEKYSGEMNQSIKELSGIFDTEIERLSITGKQETHEQKIDRLKSLQDKLDQRAVWESRLPSPEYPVFAKNIEINEWDSPETLRYKGDLLLDRNDQLQEIIHEMDARIEGLEKEARLRSRVEEFRGDIALFDDREFTMRTQPRTQEYTRQTPLETVDSEKIYSSAAADPVSSVYLDLAEELRAPLPRSAALLNQWISRLGSSREILSARADSIKNEARAMYEQANKKQER